MTANDTCALITAFMPGESLTKVVQSALEQCSRVIVVDNTPGEANDAVSKLQTVSRLTVLRSGSNGGLASALRIAMEHAAGFEFVLLLDQDSRLLPGTVAALQGLLSQHDDAAIASPAPWDETAKRFVDPRTTKRREIAEMDVVITSGMLLRCSAYEEIQGFREDFFVDCVDQDLCLQLRAKAWRILQDKKILLPHSLGETSWHGDQGSTWIRSTSHPTWRLYWMGVCCTFR